MVKWTKASCLFRNTVRSCKKIPLTVLFLLLTLRFIQRGHIAIGKRQRINETLSIRFTGGKDTLTSYNDAPVDIDIIKIKVLEQNSRCKNTARADRYFEKYYGYGAYYNYFEAEKPIQRNNIVTLAAYGSIEDIARYTEVLAVQWQGPISMAVLVSEDIFTDTLHLLLYLRHCKDPSIREYVSFHLIFKEGYYPLKTYFKDNLETRFPTNCNENVEVSNSKYVSFSSSIAKNVAKIGSKTEFVLNSHISFLPNKDILKQFWDIFSNSSSYMVKDARVVFLVPLVQVDKGLELPTSRQEAQELMNSQKARFIIKNVCSYWRTALHRLKWNDFKFKKIQKLLRFYGLRLPYIERQCDPLYDPEDGWQESANDKLKMFHLCMMDYKVEILSQSYFLVQEKDRNALLQDDNDDDDDDDDEDDSCGIDDTTAFNISTVTKLKHLYGNWKKCSIETSINYKSF